MYKIIIADDHAVVTAGLCLILEDTPDLRIIDEVRNGDDLLRKIPDNDYDLVILDICMPGKDAFDALKEIKAKYPYLPVIIFTMNPEETHAIRMLKNGAAAFVNKETAHVEIVEIIRKVLTKKKYFTQYQASLMAETIGSKETPLHTTLTNREFQILTILASGMKNSEIADKLRVSKNTVSNHRNSILRKLKLTNNSDITRYALAHSIIS